MSTNLHNIVITAKRMIEQRKTPDEVHEYLEECLANVTKADQGFYLEIGKLYLLLSLNKSFENRRNFLEKALAFCDRALEYIDTADVLALKCRLLGYLLGCVHSELKLRERVRKMYEIHRILTKLESKDSNHQEIPLIRGLMFFHISELPKDHLFNELEKISGLDREKLFYIFCGFFSVYMIAGPGCGVVCNLIGFGYPAYCSVKAIRTDTKDDDTQWLIYWTTFAAFSIVDFFAEAIYKWFPLYWLAKIIFLLYLALPQTQGAHNLYVQYVDPLFDKMNMIAKEQMKG